MRGRDHPGGERGIRFGGRRISGWPVVVVCVLVAGLAISSRARAAEVTFVLDGLSFFAYEGADASALLPAGAQIAASVVAETQGAWRITIPAASLEALPPVRYPSGRTVRWRLGAAATGVLRLQSDGTVSASIDAPLVAYTDDGAEGAPFPLRFTTGAAASRAGGEVAATDGMRLDPRSGAIQLVATGVSPAEAATAPGKPFYAVLSGQLRGVSGALSTSAP